MIGLILALGSNIGDSEENLRICINLLSKHFEIQDLSSLYLSKPVDYLKQDDFFNIVIEFKLPRICATEILSITKSTETKMGRVKKIDKGPRNIDIDILFFGTETLKQNDLIIPHPKINERNFVLFPLRELKSYSDIISFFKINPLIQSEGIQVLKSAKEFYAKF